MTEDRGEYFYIGSNGSLLERDIQDPKIDAIDDLMNHYIRICENHADLYDELTNVLYDIAIMYGAQLREEYGEYSDDEFMDKTFGETPIGKKLSKIFDLTEDNRVLLFDTYFKIKDML